MNALKEFKKQLEYIEEPMYETASKLLEERNSSSQQISEIFGIGFLKTAEEKLTETELDTVQNFIDTFYNIVIL